ncbi:MAG: glycosyltransferase [Desulfobacteraceae bacterium]
MNICMFTNTYLPHVGGVARSVSIFAEDLREMGHNVLVVAPTYPDSAENPEGEGGYEEDGVLRLPAIQNFNGSDFSVRIPIPFYIDERIDEFGPDIIHSHHPYLLGDSALRAARKRSLPLVFTHHTLYEEYTHYVTRDSEAMKRFASVLSTEYANLCSRVVAPSGSIRDLIRERGVRTRVSVVPTGVDTSFFRAGDGNSFRSMYGIPKNVPVIGHLGRLAPEKNLRFLAGAVVRVVKQNRQVRFLVVGQGPEKNEIVNIFRREGLEDSLVMPGKLTGKALADAYKAMDVFAFSSKSETQGMVLAEAMAAGVPVVALNAPGVREVVAEGENGRLLDEDAGEERFASAVFQMLDDEGLMSRFRESALETGAVFDRKRCAQDLHAIYEATAAEQSTGIKKNLLEPWEAILMAIQTEWDLFAEKARAVAGVVRKNGKGKSS